MAASDHTPSLVQKIKRWIAPLQRTPLHPHWLMRGDLLRDDLPKIRGMTLDVGCAGGAIRNQLPEEVQYIGLDYYDTATSWYGTTPQVFGDGHSLPFADESFQCVLMLHVLEHMRCPDKAIAEAMRTLAPGGLLIIEVPFSYPVHDAPLDFRRWTEFGLSTTLEQAGAENLETRSIGRPTESAAVLSCLAVGNLLLKWLRERSAWLIIAPLILLLIPLFNLIGWSLSRFEQPEYFLPNRVRAFAQKPAAG